MSGAKSGTITTSRPFSDYFIVVASFFIVLVGIGTSLSFGVFLAPIAQYFHTGRAEITGAYSLATLVAGFLGIAMGRLNDTLGPKVVVSICSITVGIGYALASTITSVWQFYLFYGFIVGIGNAGFFVPPLSTVARWFVKQRTLMTGLVLIGSSIGAMIIPRLAAGLIGSFGWRSAFAILGAGNLVVIAIFAQVLKRCPESFDSLPSGAKEGENNMQNSGYSFAEALHMRPFWLLCGIFFAFYFCINSVVAHIVMHASGMGVSLEKAAGIMVVFGGGGIIGRIFIAILGDRMGNKQTCLICFVVMFFALLYLVTAVDMFGLTIVSASIGFCFAGIGALIAPLIADYFGLKAHGMIFGVVYASDMVGGTIGPVMAGAIFDITNSYGLAFLLSAAIAFIGCILILLLR